jgi:hypothetical protein
MKTMFHRAPAAALALGLLLVANAAEAQEDYPSVVQNHLSLGTTPPCSLCHAKGNTGVGTVVTPFAWSMRSKGLVVDDPDSVVRALDALKAAHTDSDGDGVSDIDELIAGTDPNTAARVPIRPADDPTYGCGGNSISPRPPTTLVVFVGIALALTVARRTRRSRSPVA